MKAPAPCQATLVPSDTTAPVAPPTGFEPVAYSLGNCCSIRLSYGSRARWPSKRRPERSDAASEEQHLNANEMTALRTACEARAHAIRMRPLKRIDSGYG